MRITVLLFVALASMCAISAACGATTYCIVDLGPTAWAASGINNAGEVVGVTADSHAFLWDAANGVRDLGWLGYSWAYGINASGTVVGFADAGGGRSDRAFVWTLEDGIRLLSTQLGQARAVNGTNQVVGQMNDETGCARPFIWDALEGLNYIGEGRGSAYGINNSGQVVGWTSAFGGARAFLWDTQGGMKDLGALGGTGSTARAINDAGQVVGWAYDGDGLVHAFIWDSADGMRPLGTLPGWRHSYAYGINSLGQVVGVAESPEGLSCACLWQTTGEMLVLGTSFSTAYGINDLGVIVGQSGKRAVLWVPVPEPSSLLALSGGIALSGLALRRWKRHDLCIQASWVKGTRAD